MNQCKATIVAQPLQIDMNIRMAVMATDETREHARVGSLQRVGDEGEGDAVGFDPRPERPFAVRFDHMDVSVAASDEDYSLFALWRHANVPCAGS